MLAKAEPFSVSGCAFEQGAELGEQSYMRQQFDADRPR
jgi:hypothetical protein